MEYDKGSLKCYIGICFNSIGVKDFTGLNEPNFLVVLIDSFCLFLLDNLNTPYTDSFVDLKNFSF